VTADLSSSLTGYEKSQCERCNVYGESLQLTTGAGGVGRVAVGRGGAGVSLTGAGVGSQSSSGAGVDLTGGGAVYFGWKRVVVDFDHCCPTPGGLLVVGCGGGGGLTAASFLIALMSTLPTGV